MTRAIITCQTKYEAHGLAPSIFTTSAWLPRPIRILETENGRALAGERAPGHWPVVLAALGARVGAKEVLS